MFLNLKYKHISKHGDDALKHMKGRMDGTIKSILTPWKRYNAVGIDGLEIPSVNLVAALSGGGKTAFANQISHSSFDLNPDLDLMVLDFNFEMIGRNLVMRNVSSTMNMSMQYLQSAQGHKLAMEEYKEIENYITTKLANRPYYVVDEPGDSEDIQATLVDFWNQFRKKILASLDHTILTHKKFGEKSLQETLQGLGAMCTTTKKVIPVTWLVLSQLNRSIEDPERCKFGTTANYPNKADIFGSDSLYQHADMVTVIHRPALLGIYKYGPERIPCEKDTLFFHNLKVRNGEPNLLQMQADFKRMRIIDPKEALLV